ncbi:metal ABC transporter permease, partial [Proteus mirabilis]|nr:metal ABC transporter permease [Proteus mirabilis]
HYGLLSILALTIVASMQAVGIILVVAMLISPGITAYLLTRSFSRMITLAILFSVISSVIGTFISFHIDGATGPAIVL